MYTFSIFLSCLLALSMAQDSNYESEYANLYMGPYRHIYPPTVDFTQDPGQCYANETATCPLYLALMFSFGEMGSFLSSGVIPSMQIAIDQMNSDPTFLPDHNLHILVQDSQCSRKVALQNFHAHLFQPPTKMAVLGSGCSTATEATAELGPYYNLTQISCLSSSSSLADRSVFTRHFQISASEFILASGFFGVIKAFGWERIGLLTQDENLFTVTINELKRLLKNNSTVEVIERRFDTSDGIITLGENPFDPDVRVFVLSMYPVFARELLCKAYEYRIFYPRALLLVVGWYGLQWWEGNEEDQQDLMNRYGCSVQDRESVVDFITGPRKAGRTFTDGSIRADSGITGYDIEELYNVYLSGSIINQQPISFYQQCYDATWAMGRALNITYNQLKNNATLRGIVANYSTNPSETFGLQHFTYNNVKFHELLFQNLQNLDFRGIVGDIHFDENGLRVVTTVDLTQYRRQDTESGYAFTYTKVGDIIRGTADGDTELVYLSGYSTEVIFPDGIPPDGRPNEVDLGIHIGVSVIFILMATIGIVFALIGMSLHFLLRKKTVIRLSSPNLNLVIGSGAIILYIDIIVSTLPIVGETPQTAICMITPWLTAFGYSLCYGTVLAKMTRIYFIFDNPSQRRKNPLRDWKLILGVLVLVAIDAVILLSYTFVDYNLRAERISNIENPEDHVGVRDIVTKYYVYVCESRARSIGLSILYGYKMLPQVVALVFAFSIRKIKIKGLDDAKYIAFAVYITSLVTAIVIVITYTLDHYINVFAAVFCTGFLIGTTTILFLVLLPPLIGHFQDPEGAKVFPMSTLGSSDADNKTIQKSWVQQDDSTGKTSDKQIEGLKKKIVDLEKKIKNSLQDSVPQGFSTSHSGNYFSAQHSKEKEFRKSVDFSEHENITHNVPPALEEPFKNTPSEVNTEELK